MAFGFESYNDSGYLQIGDSVANYYLLYSGTIIVPPVTTLPSTPNNGTSVVITYPTSFDAICVASADGYPVPLPIFSTAVTSVTLSNRSLLTQSVVKYWLFKKYSSLTPSTSGYGVEIYDSSGNVAFSSNYPKLLRSYSTIPITDLTTTQNYSLLSDRQFAFLAYGTAYTTAVAATKASPDVKMPPAIRNYSGGVTSISSTIRTGRVSSAAAVYEGGLIAIDVTNY
jgi:hypothetical protein